MKSFLHLVVALLVCGATNAQPNCNASISTSLSGSTVTITNNSTPAASSTITTIYDYHFGDGNRTGYLTSAPISYLYVAGGTYTIKLVQTVIDSSTTTPGICMDSTTVTVTVPGIPCSTSVSKQLLGNLAWKFTANNISNTPNMTYSWLFGDGGTATGANPTHRYNSTGTYQVRLVSTNGSCTDTQWHNVVVDQNAFPCDVSVMFTTITTGYKYKFYAANVNNRPGMTYSWSFGDGNTASGDTVIHQYATPGNYTVRIIGTNGSCTDTSYKTITMPVLPNVIGGIIYVDTPQQADSYRVWLIKYDSATATLSAVDSTGTSTSVSFGVFSFKNHPAGIYRIKAARYNGPTSGTGYVPTYHDSALVWSSAGLINHTGSYNIHYNIYMRKGTVTSGPGFVAGNVNQGANKGSANGIPGMTIFLMDMSGNAVQYAVTDGNGYYSFSNIPDGSYRIYPEDLGMNTTPVTLMITAGKPSHTDINFERSLSKKTIYPIASGIANVNEAAMQFSIYPNPAKDVVTISWNATANDKAQVSIADVSGKVVYNGIATMNGATTINVSNLQSGLYFMNVNSELGNSTQKLIIK